MLALHDAKRRAVVENMFRFGLFDPAAVDALAARSPYGPIVRRRKGDSQMPYKVRATGADGQPAQAECSDCRSMANTAELCWFYSPKVGSLTFIFSACGDCLAGMAAEALEKFTPLHEERALLILGGTAHGMGEDSSALSALPRELWLEIVKMYIRVHTQ